MRIVYLDESGTSKKEQEPQIIVAGVIVHGDHQLTKLRLALANVMTDYIPEGDRDTLVLHATDLYGGNGYFDKRRKPEWTLPRRAKILDAIARIPSDLNLHVTWAHLAKDKFPYEALKETGTNATFLQVAVGAAYMTCMIEVDQWFRQNARKENCFIVVEDNNETRAFIKDQHQHHQNPLIAPGLTAKAAKYFPLRHIHEDPNFQEKRVAHPLVLADFISYFIKRRLMHDARSYPFSDPWVSRMIGLQVK